MYCHFILRFTESKKKGKKKKKQNWKQRETGEREGKREFGYREEENRFKRCHHNTQYIRQTHLHALWHFIDTDYNNNKRIPIELERDARGEEETKGKENIKSIMGWTQAAVFLNTKSFAHFVYRNDSTDLAADRMVKICFVFSDENHR